MAHYNEEVIRQSYKVMLDKLNELIKLKLISHESFLCFVDDGSKDSTWQILNEISNNQNILNIKTIYVDKEKSTSKIIIFYIFGLKLSR